MYKYTGLLCIIFFLACRKPATTQTQVPPNAPSTENLVKGADISWLTEMEQTGRKFYDTLGREQDLLILLKQYKINTIRLRVWVNPANGWNGERDVVQKALRVKAAGLKLLLNFHYSDSWADPGQQTKPAAWQNANFTALTDSLTNHTRKICSALLQAGVEPTWIQIGNETNNGFLWPDGQASTRMQQCATLIKAGAAASKQIFPAAKTIIHLSNGFDSNLFRWFFDGMVNHQVSWDVIGLSLYPQPHNWPTTVSQCVDNMTALVNRYNKEIMAVEVGMPWDSPNECYAFLKDIQQKIAQLPQAKGLGVLYWEPQANNWQQYTLGCFTAQGVPTKALNAFQ